jgi:hypothetical protein
MSTYTFDNPQLKIKSQDGLISIQTAGKPIYIREAPLSVFENFYQDWQHGLALMAEDSFLENWANNQAARGLLESALGYLGVTTEQIDQLTFSQIQALLVADGNGGPGIIFGMHSTFPKPLSSPTEIQMATKSYLKILLNLLPLLIQYFRLEYTSNGDLVTRSLQKVGLSAASCTIWLLKSILIFLGTLKNKKA